MAALIGNSLVPLFRLRLHYQNHGVVLWVLGTVLEGRGRGKRVRLAIQWRRGILERIHWPSSQYL